MPSTPPKSESLTVDFTATPDESLADVFPSKITLDFLAPSQQPDELGRLGHYRILKVLGKGGMGIVFLAEDTKLERRVALKVMLPKFAEDQNARQRFLREAKTAAAIEHDHIVHIYQVDEDRGVPYLAMQLLSGSSLEDVLKRAGPLTTPQILRLGAQIAEGLAVAHAKGLIHRDIKPANIWVEANYGGRVKLLDFGLARSVQTDVDMTQSGVILGTPAYMPPEQARGEHVDHRCDLYSLGCVLYRMATGELPIKGKDTMALLMALALNEPVPPQQINETIPQGLNDLILKLLAKDAAERPESAKAVALALCKMEIEAAQVNPASDVTGELAALAKPASAPPPSATAPEPAEPFVNADGPAAVSSSQGQPEPQTKVDTGRTNVGAGQQTQTVASRSRRRLPIVAAAVGLVAVLAAGIVIFVQTNYGTVRIEIHDPAIEVSVKGEQIVLTNEVNEFRLRAGPTTFVITRGGLAFETDAIVLRRGDHITVDVRQVGGRIRVAQGDAVIGSVQAADFALQFGGINDIARCNDFRIDATQPHTVETWLRPHKKAVGLILGLVAGPKIEFAMYQSRGNLVFDVRLPTGDIKSEVPLGSMEEWVHVAGVWDGATPRLFLNGQMVGKFSKSDMQAAKGGPVLCIGNYLPGLSLSVPATLDEIRISRGTRYIKDFVPDRRFERDQETLALYHLDEGQGDKLTDSSGHGHHGKIVGAKWVKVDGLLAPAPQDAAKPPPGRFGLQFEGSNHVDIAGLAYDPDRAITLEAWLKPTKSIEPGPFAFLQGRGTNFALWTDDDRFGFNRTTKAGAVLHVKEVLATIRRDFVHIAGVWDGNEAALFVDGKRVGKVTSGTGFAPGDAKSPGVFQIGGDNKYSFHAIVAGCRISAGARYIADFTPQPRFDADKDTLALYHFDEGQGDLLTDSSGNKHHGKIVGATWVKAAADLPAPSPLGAGLRFDGKASHIELPSLRYDANQPVTVEGFVAVEQVRDPMLFMRVAGNSWMSVTAGAEKWNVLAVHDNEPQAVTAPKSLVAGVKTHVAATWDGSRLQLFINGKKSSERVKVVNNPAQTKAGQEGLSQIGGTPGANVNLLGTIYGIRVSKAARYDQDFEPPQRLDADDTTLALYRFDEGQGDMLTDSSGNKHHGKIVGATWVKANAAAPPKAGQYALHFDGLSAHVQLPLILDQPGPITLETWVRPAQFRTMSDLIQAGQLPAPNKGGIGLGLWKNHAGFGLTIGDENTWKLAEGADALDLERWYHVAGIFDGQEARVYVDGRLSARTAVGPGQQIAPMSTVRLGGNQVARQSFCGAMRAVRITSGARYVNDFAPEYRFEPDKNTRALYHFDEGQGEMLTDSSGHGHHGKIVGARWVKAAGQ